MAVDSRAARPPGQLQARPSPDGNSVVAFRNNWSDARIVRRLIRSLDAAGVIGVFCLLMVLPSGVTRLAGSDTIETAGLRGAVSALRYSFTFLARNWRQAAANDESGIP